jgi:hypothetical protein
MPKGVFAMACICLLSCIVLAYLRARRVGPRPVAPTLNQQRFDQINQESTGNGSVNAAGVQGSVTTNNAAGGEASAQPNRKARK